MNIIEVTMQKQSQADACMPKKAISGPEMGQDILILNPDQFCNPHADLFLVYLVFNISYFKYRHPYFLSLLGALEGMEGFLPATTLPFSNLSNSPLHRVQGRLLAGWLQERPLLLLLVNHKQYI